MSNATNVLTKSSTSTSIPYYTSAIDEYKYIDSFKRSWISTHSIDKSGPIHCKSCNQYGSLQYDVKTRIFIGYCFNCAIYIHKRSRGFGICLDIDAIDYTDPPINVDLFHKYLRHYDDAILTKFYESQFNELVKKKHDYASSCDSELNINHKQKQKTLLDVEHTYDHFNADCEYNNKRYNTDNNSVFIIEHAGYYNYL